ncbi:riboflavin synthase subunit beta [Sinomicrobium weinanense]|uniref:Riboflavin synthase subunit beta n=1 Tax=Sinomicrobium weinanense TaxID=2842200 RepID=A0A926JRI7_9FLAO|nr:riboflavin synthase subunit beta [Sinomicrobium weinanense]MBC9796054.1 riboflavin synthase subunit beta [Sinomicrobium weinanense]MBU3123127.1 riboflavin synthase subunit beta [Sinomicrobium weinanense]
MGVFKTRKNKRYNYTPRYYKNDKEGSPYQMERRFDKFRKASGDTKGIKQKFSNAMDDLRANPDRRANRTILVIVIILLLLFLFIIDFDLSIFTFKR